jgi:hypothetical protein
MTTWHDATPFEFWTNVHMRNKNNQLTLQLLNAQASVIEASVAIPNCITKFVLVHLFTRTVAQNLTQKKSICLMR